MGSDHPVDKDHQKTKTRASAARGEPGAHRDHPGVKRAFEALGPRLEQWRRGPRRPLTLFVVHPASLKSELLLPDPLVTGRLSAVLLGRDARCDVCIDQDAEVSGRHALLVYRTFGYDGSCRVFDLSSGTGVLGLDRERISGEKLLPPFALVLGDAVVFGLSPSAPIEPTSDFGSIRWNRRPQARSFSTSPWDERPLGMLAARGRRGTAGVELSADALDRGVIIGANSRSPVTRALAGDDSTVCDKHTLLFRHESRTQAVDLRSERGTSYADCPISVPLPLPDAEPSRLVLGPDAYATWTPYARTEGLP